MKFTCEKETLYKNLKKIQGIVEKNPVIPIASNLRIEAEKGSLVLKATNFEVGIIVDSEAVVGGDGTIVVDAQKFFEIVREMPGGELSVSVSREGWIEIVHGERIHFNMAVLPEEQYPVVEAGTQSVFVSIEAKVLLELVKKTMYACSDDRTRDVLRGVMVEKEGKKMRMVATDGHRMAIAERELMQGFESSYNSLVIIPKKGAREIRRIAQDIDGHAVIEAGIDKKNVTVKHGGETILIRCIEGSFPDYRRVVPQNNKRKVTVSRDEIMESLKRVTIISEEETREVSFSVERDLMIIESKKAGMGDAREERPLEYNGDKFEFGLNSRYLLDVLNSFESEKVTIEVEDDQTPIMVKEEGCEDVLAIVMPMAL